MTRWERALYGGRLLPPQQQAELESLVSITTSEPIASTSATDPQGFGLGIAQVTAPKLGTFWFYEGETLAFRAVHIYLPDSGVGIAFALNSAVEGSNDESGALMQKLYDTLDAAGLIPEPDRPRNADWPRSPARCRESGPVRVGRVSGRGSPPG